MKISYLILAMAIVSIWSGCSFESYTEPQDNNWMEYLGGPDRNHYSDLKQIDSANLKDLQVAWIYHTKDSGQMQCNPLVVDGVLYAMTSSAQAFALNAETGKMIWRWQGVKADYSSTPRGLTFWQEKDDKRILFTNGSWLYAVNANSGEPINTFGDSGRVSLRSGLGKLAVNKYVVSNTPGTVYNNFIIVPTTLEEFPGAAPGHIQAFNVKSGKLEWVFHTIPHPDEFGYETWPKDAYTNKEVGGANNWSGMSVDRKRGILFVPTGSATYDYYGENRKGSNLFANCLLALDAQSGKRKWHFQMVHHDILDRDVPAPPNLVTINRNGREIDAVAQVTKQGFVFVFDRETGEPLYPIAEQPVPSSDVPGEQAWPTQPFPRIPSPFARISLKESEINPWASNKNELIEIFRKSRIEGPFTPLSLKGTIVFPGIDGGAEWGGSAVDPEGIMYVNSSEMPWLITLGKNKKFSNTSKLNGSGRQLYLTNCSSCHGEYGEGNALSGFPSLKNIGERKSSQQIIDIISKGNGKMPANTRLTEAQKNSIADYLSGKQETQPDNMKEEAIEEGHTDEIPIHKYKIISVKKFLDKEGYPAITPPWGTLNAIDLNTGKYIWTRPFGEYPELSAKGIPETGSESYGGPIVTAGGLIFIAGTKDRKFKAYDKKTGELLWHTILPEAGFATPSTYMVNGKQFLVIACGGGKLGAPSSDVYIAYSLP